jgi:hypothetical protein
MIAGARTFALLALVASCFLHASRDGAAEQSQEESSEVRQLVTFRFLPGKTSEAIGLFRTEALPLYRENPSMLRFRGLREVESPVPLDLIVVSSFSGMAGMDASNAKLRESAEERGTTLGTIYGNIASLSQSHDDQFVEMDASLGWGDVDSAPLQAFQSIRLTAGSVRRFDSLLREHIVPWERDAGGILGSETGRFLVSDGWHFFRTVGLADLGAWHSYWNRREEQAFAAERDAMIGHARVTILAPVSELSVR